MTEPLRVAFLWHMHQPYYLDDLTGQVSLPWVRLHATKAYLDTIQMLERHPGMACTINVVPCLLAQLKAYETNPDLDDAFLELSKKRPIDLNPEERTYVLRYFFMSNWDTMVRRHPGYLRLLERRGLNSDLRSIEMAAENFSNQDLLDLQVWLNLSWFGFTAQRDPRIAPLVKKGMGFSDEEKRLVLEVQAELIASIIPGWKKLLEAGQVELSTSPFYHPILPILAGTHIVRRSMPDAPLPGEFSFYEDAKTQIENGVAYYQKIFGRPPVGMWPSEGSVCPEIIPLVAGAGLKWIATDEAVLLRSLNDSARSRDLFQPYRAVYQGQEIAVFFRDRNLSDLIGFTYSKNPPQKSVQDFIGHLTRIADGSPGGTVSIILDGENPWEYYWDSGEGFLDGIYKELVENPRFKPVSMRQALAESPPQRILSRLHSGSWINANFQIWIGKPEENQAWATLERTRSALVSARQAQKIPAADLDAAAEQLYQAEGSDWFWWYGDDFNSENDAEFDRLFRQKLMNVYHRMGQKPPSQLEESIRVERDNVLVVQPLAMIHPILDGRVTHFYEWIDAGYIDVSKVRGSMHLSKNLLRDLFFGFDEQKFYLRLDPTDECLAYNNSDGLEIQVHFFTKKPKAIRFPLRSKEARIARYEIFGINTDERWESIGFHDEIGIEEIVELAVPFSLLDLRPQEILWFVVQIMKGDLEEDRYPKNGRIQILVPDRNYDIINWSV